MDLAASAHLPPRREMAECLPPEMALSESPQPEAPAPLEPEPAPDALMALRGARVRLPGRAGEIGPFDLALAPGEQVAILGPSGAGKSTLVKLMAGERPASSGGLWLRGQPLSAHRPAALARLRAVLPQSHSVAFSLPVHTVVGLGRVALLHDPELPQLCEQALAMARAAHLQHRRFDTLSGGEQARVQLARVFAQLWDVQGGLLLVDEPLAALDPGLQLELQAFCRARGHALVAVLHDINQALAHFDRLWLLRGGRLMADLPPDARALGPLEALYGIQLRCVPPAPGDPIDRLAVLARRAGG